MNVLKIKQLVVAFCLMLVAASAQSTDPGLFGTWAQEGEPASVWTFRSDGSGFMEQPNPKITARFTWAVNGKRLQVSTGSCSVPYTVVSNDGSSLVIRNDQLSAVYRLRKKA